MTICEYCIDTLFKGQSWRSPEKDHHTSAEKWQDSIKQCTICSSLLESIRDVLIKYMESDISNMLDSYLRFEPLFNVGVLGLLQPALPIYRVTLRDSSARDQYTLIFDPIEENVRTIDIRTSFGKVRELVLPRRQFQVFSTDYDKTEIPRLSNETSLDERDNSRNKRTLNRLRNWLQECNDQHKHCTHFERVEHGAKAMFVPTRLIEVGEMGQDHVRLVETGADPMYRRYATLSHCWGGYITVCTYIWNYAQHKKTIPLNANFPRNFFDAINLCRILDIKFIWIDSLCIIQLNGEDWKKEAPRMHEVYGSSYLNIAATSARNSTEGLFRNRRINLLSPSIVPCNWRGQSQLCKVIRQDFWSGELLAEPLYKRAWVSQERMLAPRTINFGSKQLFWQCLTKAACESMPHGISNMVYKNGEDELQWRRLLQQSREHKATREGAKGRGEDGRRPGEVSNDNKVNLQEVWQDAVKNYTSCNITKTEDKLPAVAGLAQVMYDCCQEEYFAGLWGNDVEQSGATDDEQGHRGDTLVGQMGWLVRDCLNVDGRPSRRQRQDEYRAPTWAWPSVVDGVIEVPRRVKVDHDTTTVLKLLEKPYLEYTDKQADASKFMSLEGGWIRATGILYIQTFCDTHDPETPYWFWHLPDVPKEEKPWLYLYPDEPLPPPSQASAHHSPDIETSSDDVHHLRDFIILPLFIINEGGFYSGRALAVQEEKDPSKYKFVPEPEDRGLMLTRIGLVEFWKVDEDLWERFTSQRHGVHAEEDSDDGDGETIALTLL